MSVYVDPLIDYGWKLGPSCHMTADSIEELNSFAVKIGMKTSWLQHSAREMPHYDLVASKRKLAVQNGAIELSMREAGKKYEQFYKLKGGEK
jgi:hypothetical protein